MQIMAKIARIKRRNLDLPLELKLIMRSETCAACEERDGGGCASAIREGKWWSGYGGREGTGDGTIGHIAEEDIRRTSWDGTDRKIFNDELAGYGRACAA